MVSKVAMSACALMTALVLASSMDPARFYDGSAELERAAEELRDLAEKMMASGAACSAVWTVPALSDGAEMTMTVGAGTVRAASADREAAVAATCSIHSWAWDGEPLNESEVLQRDRESPPVSVTSGEVIRFRTIFVTLGNEATLCAFAERPG